MEKYYFIQQNGVKKGAFKLNELKAENIYFDELVWRSDEDKWKKASEFEELAGVYLIKPPLTPLEIEKNEIDKEFLKKVIPNLLGIYFIIFLIISISSYFIANSSWEEVRKPYLINKDDVGKNVYNALEDFSITAKEQQIKQDSIKLKKLRLKLKTPSVILSILKADIKVIEDDSIVLANEISTAKLEQQIRSSNSSGDDLIKPIYEIPENIISQEEIYSHHQLFLIRPLYAYFSKLFLTREEQNSAGKLFINIALSTFSLLLIVLIINLTTIYSIKISKANSSQ